MNNISINKCDKNAWNDFVLEHSQTSFYHLYEWKDAICKTFGFKSFYMALEEDGKVCGILPLIQVSNFFENKIVSIPIGVHAGPIANNDKLVSELIEKAVKLTKEKNCDYLEIRSSNESDKNAIFRDSYVTFKKPLPKSPESCLSELPRKARAAARHAIDYGLTYSMGLEYIDICYDLYALNQKVLGSPVVSKKWFLNLTDAFKEKINILVIKYKGKIIASVLTFFYKDAVMPFYAGCLPGLSNLNANNFMYLKMQEEGVKKGYRTFDFGRSRKGSGSYQFKINQGFTPTELHYQYYLNKAKKIPEISPSNKSFKLAGQIWRRLPVPLANWLGPKLFKQVLP